LSKEIAAARMLDELIALVRAGGPAASPLALSALGLYDLQLSASFPAPLTSTAPWSIVPWIALGMFSIAL
jgi:hypothetical protein